MQKLGRQLAAEQERSLVWYGLLPGPGKHGRLINVCVMPVLRLYDVTRDVTPWLHVVSGPYRTHACEITVL
jgi:hypothetical protein